MGYGWESSFCFSLGLLNILVFASLGPLLGSNHYLSLKRNIKGEIHSKVILLCGSLLCILIEIMLSSLGKQFNGLYLNKAWLLRLLFPPKLCGSQITICTPGNSYQRVITWTHFLKGTFKKKISTGDFSLMVKWMIWEAFQAHSCNARARQSSATRLQGN